MNWKVRLKNKTFWVTIIPAILVLIHQLLKCFGIDFDYSAISGNLINLVEAAFVVLSILGIVNDPTTAGLTDSTQAMTYEYPKDDAETEDEEV